MKFLVVLAALVALCAGDATPLFPEDISHYAEDGNAYFGVPNGDGLLQFVEVKEPMTDEALRLNRNIAQFTITGNANRAEITVYIHTSRAQELLKHLQESKNIDL